MPSNAVETPATPSNADFHSLEEKILKTIELLKVERAAKDSQTSDYTLAHLRELL